MHEALTLFIKYSSEWI